jgi:hypothetical protein
MSRLSLSHRALVGCITAVLLAACATPTVPEPEGQWGSASASLALTRAGGTIQYQCGDGTIDSTWTMTVDGRFSGVGKHYSGGGPVAIVGRVAQAASYSGEFRGNVLTLTVELPQSVVLGPFRLVRGVTGVGPVCL